MVATGTLHDETCSSRGVLRPAVGEIITYRPVQLTEATALLRTISQGMDGPDALVLDGSGNLYVANSLGETVTVYAQNSKKLLRTISHNVEPLALAFDGSGNLCVANAGYADGHSTVKIYAAGSKVPMRTIFQGINSPDALAFGP